MAMAQDTKGTETDADKLQQERGLARWHLYGAVMSSPKVIRPKLRWLLSRFCNGGFL